jgi:hypothetical protein
MDRIKALKTPYADMLVELLNFFAKSYKTVFGFDHPPLHGFDYFVLLSFSHPLQTLLLLHG